MDSLAMNPAVQTTDYRWLKFNQRAIPILGPSITVAPPSVTLELDNGIALLR